MIVTKFFFSNFFQLPNMGTYDKEIVDFALWEWEEWEGLITYLFISFDDKIAFSTFFMYVSLFWTKHIFSNDWWFFCSGLGQDGLTKNLNFLLIWWPNSADSFHAHWNEECERSVLSSGIGVQSEISPFLHLKTQRGKKKKSICMLVETRIHLTLTELRSLEFCYSPALHDIYTQSIRFREGGRQKKSGGWWGRRSNKKWLTTEQGLDIQQMGAKKVSMSRQIKLITQTFFKLGVFFF